jgi:hypothetical protein
MDFWGNRGFELEYNGITARFSPVENYYKLMFTTGTTEHVTTGCVELCMDTQNSGEAFAVSEKFLFDLEHLLTLGHFSHVFFTSISCYDVRGNRWIATRGLGGRTGEPGRGCYLWPDFTPLFLQESLPRLDAVAGFRWGLYWYNEVTSLSTSHSLEIEIPSLWTALEVMASSRATLLGKDRLLSNKEVDNLKERIRPALVEMKLERLEDQILGHMTALRWPLLLGTIEDLLRAYGLQNYMDEAQAFYKLRNNIVHGRTRDLKGETLRIHVDRVTRFRRLLQKVLFSMAGVYHMNQVFKAPITEPDLSAI